MESGIEEKKLPVVKIFLEVLYVTKKNFFTLFKFSMPFFLLGILMVAGLKLYWPQRLDFELVSFEGFFAVLFEIIMVAAGTAYQSLPGGGSELVSQGYIELESLRSLAVLLIIGGLLFSLSSVMAVIGFHRTFLLNTKTKIFRWTWREMRYVGWWVLLLLFWYFSYSMLAVVSFILTALSLLGQSAEPSGTFVIELVFLISGLLFLLLCFYVISRWSLVLPAAAIDMHNLKLSWSWRLSSLNGWRLTFLIGFLPLMTEIFFIISPEIESVFYSLTVICVWVVVFVIEIGLLSRSYDYLSKTKGL